MRIIKALCYSINGIKDTYKSEAAFRQELMLAIILIPVALMCHAGAAGKAIMLASVLLVLIVELANTAIEAVVDRVSKTSHALSKKAKDAGSAMVLVALINVVAVYACMLLGWSAIDTKPSIWHYWADESTEQQQMAKKAQDKFTDKQRKSVESLLGFLGEMFECTVGVSGTDSIYGGRLYYVQAIKPILNEQDEEDDKSNSPGR